MAIAITVIRIGSEELRGKEGRSEMIGRCLRECAFHTVHANFWFISAATCVKF